MDIEATAPLIVINASISPDTLIQVTVSRSMHILDNSPIIKLTNATVEVYEDDVLMGTLPHWKNGIFKGNLYAQIGKTYTIKVTNEGLPDAEAHCTVPAAPEIVDIDTATTYDEYNNAEMRFSLSFRDKAGEKNYYHVFAMQRYSYMEYDPYSFTVDTLYQTADTVIVDTTWGIETPVERFEPLWLQSEDIVVSQQLGNNYGVILSDELIEGQDCTLRFSSYMYFPGEDSVTMYFYLKEITEDLYRYYYSYEEHLYAKDDPFSEPVTVFSNVNNGLGIVGAFAQDVDSIKLSPNDYRPNWWGGEVYY
jgi:hypothetical protein